MLKIYPSIHRVYNIIHVCLVYYQKGVEDWFGCGKLNVLTLYFFASRFSFSRKYK